MCIAHVGTDREEGRFSHVRIQDRVRNCAVLHPRQKSAIGAEIKKILNENPQWYCGYKRREVTTYGEEEHVNPASYYEGVYLRVCSANLPQQCPGGREGASQKLELELGINADWSVLGKGSVNIMRLHSKCVGSSLASGAAGLGIDTMETDDERFGRPC